MHKDSMTGEEVIDYDILFKNFLISKELFEQYFDKAKQDTFRNLMNSKEKKR